MSLFKSEKNSTINFEYLDTKSMYFDSACQTLRPQQVVDAVNEYYHKYNSCGGRVKYEWGLKTDERIQETRDRILKLLDKSSSDYVVAFTLNTSYGINLILSQLSPKYEKIITSEIEHNSVFLPTMEVAKRLGIQRLVLERDESGALQYSADDLSRAVVVLNSMSNIDGRTLSNLKTVAQDVRSRDGIILVDAAQGIGHGLDLIKDCDYDALFFSGHKFYAPSVGVIVIKRTLLLNLDHRLVGGGTVEDVEKDSYKLVSSPENLSDRLEIGLQDFAAIIGLGESIKWQESYRPEGMYRDKHQSMISKLLFNGLKEIPSLKIINSKPSPIISFYTGKIDAHRLAIFLSSQNIMVRSGYFCCHYYLKNVKKYPPLIRISLGLHNTKEQVEKFLEVLKAILTNI